EDIGSLPKQAYRLPEQIVEIECCRAFEPPLVGGVDRSEWVSLPHHVFREQQGVLPGRNLAQDVAAPIPAAGQPCVAQGEVRERQLLALVRDAETRIVPCRGRLSSQYVHADGVKRPDGQSIGHL